MREILFRGKAVDADKWIYGDLRHISDGHGGYILCIVDNTSGRNNDVTGIEVSPNTVGQYTGMTDKNSTKIFEGDIVRYGDTIHEVVFEQRNGTAYFGLVYSESETLPFGHYQDLRQIEVIGNIYDTPELLKGAMKPAATDVAQSGLAPATENFSLQEA